MMDAGGRDQGPLPLPQRVGCRPPASFITGQISESEETVERQLKAFSRPGPSSPPSLAPPSLRRPSEKSMGGSGESRALGPYGSASTEWWRLGSFL